jgi:hypothetical protein
MRERCDVSLLGGAYTILIAGCRLSQLLFISSPMVQPRRYEPELWSVDLCLT